MKASRRLEGLLVAGVAVLLALLVISVIILAVGKNPLLVFSSLLQGAGWLPKPKYAGGRGVLTDFMGLLDAMTPMLFAALAVAIAFRAGLFNIGVAGQMLAAGFLATVIVGYSPLTAVLAKPLVLLVGLAVGGALGAFVGFLKARFNIHEVVSTIMLNYIVLYITSFFIKSYYIDPVSRQSRAISSEARLTLMNVDLGGLSSRLPLCFLLAVALAVLFYLLLARTRLGFEIRAVGKSRKAAQYSGINARRTIVLSMALSGCSAGLAGVTYYLGCFNSILPAELSNIGFDSIAVALLANSNPLGSILSSLLITTLTYGSNYMSSTAGISEYIASLMIGVVLLFSACGGFFQYLLGRRRKALELDKEATGGAGIGTGGSSGSSNPGAGAGTGDSPGSEYDQDAKAAGQP
ncbi:MAG: ABC transporter permease [Actinomycetia bacterium]|nr:ABC transporter permease [Actinomycetes bacterium]